MDLSWGTFGFVQPQWGQRSPREEIAHRAARSHPFPSTIKHFYTDSLGQSRSKLGLRIRSLWTISQLRFRLPVSGSVLAPLASGDLHE